MELHVVETEGMPEGCILSIRAGATRRQAPASADRPFKFPIELSEATPFKLDVLEPVASARFILRPGDEKCEGCQFTIPMDETAKLEEGPSATAKRDEEPKMQMSFTVRPDPAAAPSEEQTATDEREKKGESSSSSRCSQVVANREYLDKHNLVEFTQQLVQAVIKEQPDRPYAFMASQFLFPAPQPRR